MNKQSCPKCQEEMEQGFVLDNTYGGTPRLSLVPWATRNHSGPVRTLRKKNRSPLARFAARVEVIWNLLRGQSLVHLILGTS